MLVLMSQCKISEFAETKARPADALEVVDGVQTVFEDGVQIVPKLCVGSYFLRKLSVSDLWLIEVHPTYTTAPSLRAEKLTIPKLFDEVLQPQV